MTLSHAWRVSVVIPVRNGRKTLPHALSSVLPQLSEHDEVVIVVGPSEDGTATIAEAAVRADARVRVVDNPSGSTPAALNLGIASTTGQVVVRLDAHAELPDGYVRRAVRTLEVTGAGNVGGRQVPSAEDGFASAVAAAMRSPLGAGGAAYRTGTTPGPAETVYLGVYRREAIEEVGGFDERLLRNQDYELNHRLRQAGWKVWFDPSLEVRYRPRGTLRALASQYRDYGRYKRLVMREHPSSIRWRQLVPLGMVSGITASLVVGVARHRPLLPAVAVGCYLGVLVAGASAADYRRCGPVAMALATMHWSWAVGFMQGPPDDPLTVGAQQYPVRRPSEHE